MIALLVAGTGVRAYAQDRPLAPLILRLPGSTRALAMGGADIGGREDDVLFYNPAQLAVARGTSLSTEAYTRANLFTTFSTVFSFGPGAIGIGAQSLLYTDAPGSYSPPAVLGQTDPLPATDMALTIGYGQRFKYNTRIGGAITLLDDQVGASRDSRAAFEAGIARDMLKGTFGLSVQNVGDAARTPRRKNSHARTCIAWLPMERHARWPLRPHGYHHNCGHRLHRGGFVSGSAGGELGYGWIDGYSVAVRGGVRRPGDGEGPWTAGLGFTADRISLDYAFESRDHAHGAHRIGVRIR